MKQNISEIEFYKARTKINPNAIYRMQCNYIPSVYKLESNTLKKLKGYYVLTGDGSDIVLPSSLENEKIQFIDVEDIKRKCKYFYNNKT